MTHFAIHTNEGAQFTDGPPEFGKNSTKFEGFQGKVKAFVFSEDGKRFAWIAEGQVFVVEAPSWERIGSLKHPRAQEICFSPRGKFLAIWESYVKTTDQSQIQPNLSVYDVTGKKPLKSFFQQSQVNWQPQWTNDETIFARSVNNEVHFYKADDLQNIEEKKILPKVRSFSISPSIATHYVNFFVPSIKGAPAYVHLYRYPNFKEASNALANKSFFKVDTIDSFWNKQSTACLLLTAAEMDKSGTSYYGEHMLFYLNTRGDSSRVTFSKAGNIHSVAWCPNGQEFFAVYGTMPSKATLYNHKCEAIAEFGSGARNTVLVNPVGNIALVGGFGNIAARYETWDIAARKKIDETECPDSTSFSWSPCGQYLLTATCSPRLRVNNGYKVWHYTAVLQHETFINELYSAQWLPDPEAAKPFTVSVTPATGIESSIVAASKEKYILPRQRGAKGPVGFTNTEKKFLSEVDDPTKNEAPAQLSKSALKNKKKREAAKKKHEEEGEGEKAPAQLSKSALKNKKREAAKKIREEEREACNNWREGPRAEAAAPFKSFAANIDLTGDPEKDKKIRNFKKKLDAIAKLKGEQENGKLLEKNQLDKIATEEKLIKDLEELTTL